MKFDLNQTATTQPNTGPSFTLTPLGTLCDILSKAKGKHDRLPVGRCSRYGTKVFLCFSERAIDYTYYIGYIYIEEEGEDMHSNLKQLYFFCLHNKDFKKEFKSGIISTIKCYK